MDANQSIVARCRGCGVEFRLEDLAPRLAAPACPCCGSPYQIRPVQAGEVAGKARQGGAGFGQKSGAPTWGKRLEKLVQWAVVLGSLIASAVVLLG